MSVSRALTYLNNVLAHKEIIPVRHFTRGVSRKAQCKNVGANQGRWPESCVKALVSLLENAKSNANSGDKSLDTNALVIKTIQANAAGKMRRRTHRAHGRIGAYQASPAHVELILEEDAALVPKAPEPESAAGGHKKPSQKKLAKLRRENAARSQ